ncbi:MAG: 5'/3'-nucleotidase SurE [Gemmatimonadales bacterium]|nr:5'/3'-nucleotidase SurE [Gemmatimonadales bacterium]
MDKQLHVLISNDDGIEAPGIKALEETIRSMEGYRVTVVAPHDQQSASSHSLTLTSPLRILDQGEGRYAVTGTPTDSVLVAMEKILRSDPPDIVVSGINHGPNMGEDVIYSGTVAAAMEGTMIGLPSYAFSLAEWGPKDFSGAVGFLRRCLPDILAFPLPHGTLLNINIPSRPVEDIQGVRVTRLGNRVYQNVITDQVDPHGKPYFWIGGKGPTWEQENGTDYCAVEQGFVSITPLMIDLTDHELRPGLKVLESDGIL